MTPTLSPAKVAVDEAKRAKVAKSFIFIVVLSRLVKVILATVLFRVEEQQIERQIWSYSEGLDGQLVFKCSN